MRDRIATRQTGFTLVEIAIVLVIIGLLLGGILKGQEMINNSRVKAAANDINGVIAAYNSYVDRYRRIPGDDNNGGVAALSTRGGLWTTAGIGTGDGNGSLNAPAANTFNGGTVESAAFWQHMRAAGLLTGNPGDAGAVAPPTNSFNGRIGVAYGAIQGRAASRIVVCLSNVPGAMAAALDVQLDDGNPATGTLRATIGTGVAAPVGLAAPAPYVESNYYTVCRDVT